MREYGQVQSSFWQSSDAKAFSDRGKLLAVYLLTSPHSNGLGCFNLGDGAIWDDLKWSTDVVFETFLELSRNGWANRFETVVFLPAFLKWNKIANSNIAKARFGEFLQLPKGDVKVLAARAMLAFSDFWTEEHKEHLETVAQTVTQTVSKPFPESQETRITEGGNQNPTQPNPTQPKPTPLPRKRATSKKGEFDSDGFDRFYALYPRKVSKASAMKAYAKIAPSAELLDVMLTALVTHCTSKKWRTEPEFIPHPSTWLNGERWNDQAVTTNGSSSQAAGREYFNSDDRAEGARPRDRRDPPTNGVLPLADLLAKMGPKK